MLSEHEWTNVRRSTAEIRPPNVKPAREDYRDLSETEQLQVSLVQQELAHVAICSVRVQTYLRRHGNQE